MVERRWFKPAPFDHRLLFLMKLGKASTREDEIRPSPDLLTGTDTLLWLYSLCQ